MSNTKKGLLLLWIVALVLHLGLLLTSNFSSYNASSGFDCKHTEPVSGRCEVIKIENGGAAEKSGLMPGDYLEIPEFRAAESEFNVPNARVALNAYRGDQVVPILITVKTEKKSVSERLASLQHVVIFLAGFISTLLIILSKSTPRSYNLLTIGLISLMFVGFGGGSSSPLLKEFGSYTQPLATVLAFGGFFSFWRSFASELQIPFGKVSTATHWLVWFLGCGMFALGTLDLLNNNYWGSFRWLVQSIVGDGLFVSGFGGLFDAVFGSLAPIASLTAALTLIQKLQGETANRAYWVVTAFCGFFIPWSLISPIYLFFGHTHWWKEHYELINAAQDYLSWLMPFSLLAFAYFSISQRLLSYQFAFNKTVLYLLTGTVLIVAFIFLKQNVEELFEKDPESQKSLTNAALAILVFLAKQLRDVADSTLRKFIFSNLSKKENRLLDFRSKIGHYATVPALIENLREELSEFCHRVEIEIYEADRNRYRGLTTGSEMNLDDEIPVLLRAKQTYVMGGFRSASYRIVFPMLDRNALIGFVGVQESSKLPTLRPDEIRLIDKVVRQCATHIALLELDELRKAQNLSTFTSGEATRPRI